MFKTIIANTTWQVVGKIVTASSTLLITLLIGKSLGPAGFGDFTKIFVFVGYFYTFADFGLNSIFVKTARDESASTLFKSLTGLRIVLALLLAAFAILITFFLPYDPVTSTGFSPIVKVGIIIASLTIVTQALLFTSNAFFQKNLRYDLSTVATIAGTVLMIITTIILSIVANSILPFIFVYVAGGVTSIAVAFFLIRSKFRQSLKPVFNKGKSMTLLNLSWPIGASLVLNLLYFRIDIFILSNVRTSSEVGLYGLAYQFFQAALAVPIFFSNALYPILAKQYREKSQAFKTTVKNWTIYLLLFSIAATVFLIVVSYLIPVLYDTRYQGSAEALRILSLGMPFFFITALIWHLLIIYGKEKLLIYAYAVGAVFNLIANLIFIPVYGFIAAATITVVSEFLILLILAGILKRVKLKKL